MIRIPRIVYSFILLLPQLAFAQPRAAECFYSVDFETIDQFSGWGIGAFVETQTAEGQGTGELIPAWEIANATEANADGYFPVLDRPFGNRFVQANDAASPCNCDMNDVALSVPVMDFSARTGVSMECRVFHEGTKGAGEATIEVRAGQDEWSPLLTTPTALGVWQDLFVDLSGLDGMADVGIRFRWSDGGGWSSGFAMDDFCLRERLANDVSVTKAFMGDPSASAFDMSQRTLAYRQLPVEQFTGLSFGMELMNRGTLSANVDNVEADLLWDGVLVSTINTSGPGALPPGQRATVHFTDGWAPPGPGELTVEVRIPTGVPDDDISDNSMRTIMEFTGAGWDAGYGAMAIDGGFIEGKLGSTGSFVLANRMEIGPTGSTARGISVQLSSNSTLGEEIRAILFNGDMAFVDTSFRHTITQQDLENAYIGLPLYLPLALSPTLASGDYFAGIQHLETGDVGLVEIAMGGEAPIGASVLLEGSVFAITYTQTAPMVRLHVQDLGIGLAELGAVAEGTLRIHPSPTTNLEMVRIMIPAEGRSRLRMLSSDGRVVLAKDLGFVQSGLLDMQLPADLGTGTYVVQVFGADRNWLGRLVVVE